MAVFDAPEMASLRWGIGLASAATIVGLLVVSSRHPSQAETPQSLVWLSLLLVVIAAALVAMGALLLAGSYPAPDWLLITSGVTTFVVSATAAGTVTVKRRHDRVLPPLRFLLIVTVSGFAFLAVFPWACAEAASCASVFGNPAPRSPLLSVAAGLTTAGISWALLARLTARRDSP